MTCFPILLIEPKLGALGLHQLFEDTGANVEPLAGILELQAADPAASTTVRDPQEAVDRHVADSLVALELDIVRAARRIADLGAGAGWPGGIFAAWVLSWLWIPTLGMVPFLFALFPEGRPLSRSARFVLSLATVAVVLTLKRTVSPQFGTLSAESTSTSSIVPLVVDPPPPGLPPPPPPLPARATGARARQAAG